MKKHSYRAVEAFRGADKTIRIVGHRGARGVFPENTMIGFKSTIEMGINLLEFDVVLCADGVPVITNNHALHAPTFKCIGGSFIDHEPKFYELLAHVASLSDNNIYLMLEIKSDPKHLNNDIFRKKLVSEVTRRVRD